MFYAKKLPQEVQDMLVADKLSVDAFLGWWKGAKIQKDFWVETPKGLIRAHVVPRKNSFTPVGWNATLVELKQNLLKALGDTVVEERVPTSGVQFLSSFARKGEREPEEQPILWIGRSCFKQFEAPSPSTRHMSLPALWSMSKTALVEELAEYGITAYERW